MFIQYKIFIQKTCQCSDLADKIYYNYKNKHETNKDYFLLRRFIIHPLQIMQICTINAL